MKKLCIALFLFITTINLLSAQTIINAELKGLLQKSVTYFPKVKEVEQSVQLAEQKLKLTELNKYPDVTMDASYAYVRPKIEVPFGANTFQFAPVHNFSAAVNGTYALIDFGRLKANIEKSKLELSEEDCAILSRAKNIHAQSILKKKDKDIYKKENKIIYSFHAPEVECIGKGKLNKPYEFGNKVGIAVSGRGNFVLGVKSFHGNPYDGHTLDQTVVELRKLSPETSKIFVDLGYTGHNFKEKGKVFTAKTKKTLSNDDKKMQKRRSAIEPIIGHLKNFGRMGRNYLKGVVGDIVNPLISAVGLNLRRITNILKDSTA